jgi:RNA polymerase sigma-70 factor (ECF subfamily)
MVEDEFKHLVERAAKGDEVAFGALYDAFAPRLYRFFRYRASDATAEDLTQKVFLKMIEQLPTYRDQGAPFAAWLFRVARNAWIDQHRTSHPAIPLEALTAGTRDEEGPEALAVKAAEWETVRKAVCRLPGDQRDVIAFRFFAGLSPRETAAQMGCSEGSVRTLQYRALGTLRRYAVAWEAAAREKEGSR